MRRYRTLRTLAILLLTTVLYACGTRGPLFLPPVQNKPAKPATTPAKTPSGSSVTATAANVPTTAADPNTPTAAAQ